MSASSKKKLRKEQNAAQLTEKQLNEKKETKKLKTYTVIFSVVIALVLVVGLGSLAFTAFENSGISERSSKAMTVGEHTLTSAELSYFYMDAINNTYQNWYNSFGEYTSAYVSMFYGLDMTQPLNAQIYNQETNQTYADYFAEMAADNAVSTYAMYDLAVAEGHTLTDAEKASLDDSIANLAVSATASGYSNKKTFLKAYYGNGATEKTFVEYLEVLALAASYQQAQFDALTYTESDLNAYNAEHFDEFSSFSYCSFYMTDDDFLVCTAKSDETDHKHSDTELELALSELEKAVDTLETAAPTNAEELNEVIKTLSAYAEKESVACEEINDLLYTSVTDDDLAAWLIEEGRAAGDITVLANTSESTDDNGNTVTTINGYTFVLFLERNDNDMNLVNVRHILKQFATDATDEDKLAIKTFLEGVQTNWASAGKTEDGFAELAKLNSEDSGSAAVGGLYENVYPGQMVTNFNNWCFDEARQVGDSDIVETEYGYHLMYFAGTSDTTYRNYMIENTLRNADYEAWYTAAVEAVESELLDTSKLSLDMILVK